MSTYSIHELKTHQMVEGKSIYAVHQFEETLGEMERGKTDDSARGTENFGGEVG
jgi:hypothetical protein